MKKLSSFISGIITMAIIVGLTVTALAASGTVSFNTVNLALNGDIISTAGDGFTLDNGEVVPSSIVYTDGRGGGTTYLPVRRTGELLGIDIEWNADSAAVEIVTENYVNTEQPTPTHPLSNMSYEEFRAMLVLQETAGELLDKPHDHTVDGSIRPPLYYFCFNFGLNLNETQLIAEWNNFCNTVGTEYITRLFLEYEPLAKYNCVVFRFYNDDRILGHFMRDGLEGFHLSSTVK